MVDVFERKDDDTARINTAEEQQPYNECIEIDRKWRGVTSGMLYFTTLTFWTSSCCPARGVFQNTQIDVSDWLATNAAQELRSKEVSAI